MARDPNKQQPFRQRSHRIEELAKRFEDQAADILEEVANIATPEDLPEEALLRLMMANALAPAMNAQQSVATLKTLADMKGWTGKKSDGESPDVERLMEEFLAAQKGAKGPRRLPDAG